MSKIKAIKLYLLSYIVVIAMTSIITSSFSLLAIQMLLFLPLAILITKLPIKFVRNLLIIFITSSVFVFMISISNNLMYGNSYYFGGSDDLQYEQFAKLALQQAIFSPSKLLDSGIISAYHNSPGFINYLSVIMLVSNYLGSYSTFIPRFINTFILQFICILLFFLLKNITSTKEKTISNSILFFSIFPLVQIVTSHIFRDVINLFQVLAGILIFIKIFKKGTVLHKIFMLLLYLTILWSTYYIRVSSIFFIALTSFIILMYKLRVSIPLTIFTVLILFIVTNIFEVIRFDYFVNTYSNYLQSSAEGGFSAVVFSQPIFPIGWLLRSVYAFMTPFPNFFALFKSNERIINDAIYFLIYIWVIIQLMLVPFFILRLRKIELITIIFLVMFFGIILTTFTFRHIIFYYPLYTFIAMDEYSKHSNKSKTLVLSISTIVLVFLGISYFSILYLS